MISDDGALSLKSCGHIPINQTLDELNLNIIDKRLCRVNVYECLSQLVDLDDKYILDWGCRNGFFIFDSFDSKKINISKYTGVDVSTEKLNELKSIFPDANTIHYDKFNQQYNPNGSKNPEWCLDENDKFDVIFSHSVFNHISFEEFEYVFNKQKNHLRKNGIIIHHFCDLYNVTDAQFMLPRDELRKYLKGEYFPNNELYRFDDNVVTKYDDNSFNNCERFDSMFSRHYVKEKLNCEINDYDMLLCSAIYKREEDKWHYQS